MGNALGHSVLCRSSLDTFRAEAAYTMYPFKKKTAILPSKEPNYSTFAEKCVEEMRGLQEKFQSDYDLTWYENWFYNQTTGLLTFSTGDKELNFRYFDVGSYAEKSNSWKWSWDNETTLDSAKEMTKLVKEFGERLNFPKHTLGQFPSNEIEAWELTAITAKLSYAIGV